MVIFFLACSKGMALEEVTLEGTSLEASILEEPVNLISHKGVINHTKHAVAVGGYGIVTNHTKHAVALDGYDVVAYFKNFENGITNKGKKGSKKIFSKYKDILYYFSSQENKDLFVETPEDYIPAYGGWCAWAMSYGENRVKVDYDTFMIAPDANGKNRLYLFYNFWGTNTLKKWLKGDHKELVEKSDRFWQSELKKVSAQ